MIKILASRSNTTLEHHVPKTSRCPLRNPYLCDAYLNELCLTLTQGAVQNRITNADLTLRSIGIMVTLVSGIVELSSELHRFRHLDLIAVSEMRNRK